MPAFGTFLPPRIVAQHQQKCAMCNKQIRRFQDELMKDFETGWWVHTACLASDLESRRDEGDPYRTERLQAIQHFRDGVVDSVRCPRCASPIGANCRELGVERLAVHRQRIAAAERSSTVVVTSGQTA